MKEGTIVNGFKRPVKATALLVLSFALGFALWAYFYPVTTGSTIFWIGAVLMGVPIYCVAEGMGSLVLNAKYLNKWPRFLRISFGVVWGLSCIAVLGLVIFLLSSMLVEEL